MQLQNSLISLGGQKTVASDRPKRMGYTGAGSPRRGESLLSPGRERKNGRRVSLKTQRVCLQMTQISHADLALETRPHGITPESKGKEMGTDL